MSCSCFSSHTNSMTVAEPNPAKHVNFNVGMVLGVDDFTQEFAYLSGRDQWLARDLIGYGTVRGLNVRMEVDAPSLSRLESGKVLNPTVATLHKWAEALRHKLVIDLASE